MRIIILLHYFFLISILTNAQQSEYEIQFKNGEQHSVTISEEDPLLIPRGNLTIEFFKFGLIENGAYGPFTLNLNYQRIFSNNNSVLEGNLCFLPIDTRYLEKDQYDLRVFDLSGGLTYKKYFLRKEVTKNKKVHFISNQSSYNSRHNGAYSYNVIYRAKLPISFERRYGLRGGFNLSQNSLGQMNSVKPADNEFITVDNQKYMCLFLGMSRARFLRAKYSSSTFGENIATLLGEVYLDFLISPWIGVYGVHYSYNPGFSGENKIDAGKIDKKYYNQIPRKYIGARLGGHLKVSGIQWKRLASYVSYEFAYYPGVAKNNFTVSAGYGLTIFGKK